MKKYLSLIAVTWLVSIGNAFAENLSPADTVLKYYEASREGNIAEIKTLIAGSFYNRRKALLDNNESYADFLKSHYKGSKAVINTVNDEGNVAIVSVQVTYASDNTETSKLLLKKVNNHWAIADKLSK